MKHSLSPIVMQHIGARVRRANLEYVKKFPGESQGRQPVHTVYGGAHLFKSDTAAKLGALALKSLDQHAPDAATFGRALAMSNAEAVFSRVREKLQNDPVEDYRLDFEDGYGYRSDAEEDAHAVSAAGEVAAGFAARTLPAFIGIRIKPFTEEFRDRGMRTLDLFLTALISETHKLPPHFIVTYPKPVIPEQVAAVADLLDMLESTLGIERGTIRVELMVETTQSIRVLRELAEAARGRCFGAHFGAYDYTASCGITALHQHMLHPACDYARNAMQVAFAGTAVHLSDGATNVMPVGDAESVHRAWKLHYDHVRHSLDCGFYQGWDLHPAQLPTRYAAVYSFFLEGLEETGARLRHIVARAVQASMVGEVFDDAATGRGLLNYFRRAVNCGAITEAEAHAKSGLTEEELRSESFTKILQNRA